MKKHLFILSIFLALALMLGGCVASPKPQPINLSVIIPDGNATVESSGVETINKSMAIENDQLGFKACRVFEDTAYMAIKTIGGWGKSGDDVWFDLQLIRKRGIKKLKIYLLSGGGSPYDGLSVSDELRLLKKDGVFIEIHGRGIIASAAVPIYLSASKGGRIASKNTTFLLHPAKIEKGGYFSENLKDLQSQAKMIKMLNDSYVSIVAENSNLSRETVTDMIEKDTWVTAEQALEYGFVDEIR
ncbi:MAG: ATP-dependent Clp protease proteolytic subunit [Nanoarchaeota archaeon]|nr:ATP-dependent Clp protease proteolytic subunit [Nanoarchaeota archaeon]